ncbi:unnamed protein product [Camellia sinensis]
MVEELGGFSASSSSQDFHNPVYNNSASKRMKIFSESNHQKEETSPLGLTLRKTPSFVNLVEMKLSQARGSSSSIDGYRAKMDDSQPIVEKLKASNFPASLLKIGTWERLSKHEGDLIAKSYYAKKKIVWEVLEGPLKSKIEIQWSEIEAIRATIRDNEPGILEIELKQPPQFFRETNPQPRKHTLWQQSSDFTGGQAPLCRRHYVKFPPGILEKHYEKLLQCDHRLFVLSQKPFPTLESPYFCSNIFGATDMSFDFRAYQSPVSPRLPYSFSSIPTSSFTPPRHPVHNLRITKQPIHIVDSNSPMSVMDFPRTDENVNNYMFDKQTAAHWDQERKNVENINATQGLRPTLTSAAQSNVAFSCQGYRIPAFGGVVGRPNPNTEILCDIENHLLSDSLVVCSDERTVLSRVKSMCSLLEPSEEAMNPVRNVGTNHNIGVNNSILGTTEHFKTHGGLVYPQQPICYLPPKVSYENQMMHLSRNNYRHALSDPKVDDYEVVDADYEVRRWT